ncbi:MAG: hypothetical protein HON23_01455 [Rickettsiales bacterium]|jgi:hypothetical protein|nr:hypothetical protein [Rickettsiales bacterium]
MSRSQNREISSTDSAKTSGDSTDKDGDQSVSYRNRLQESIWSKYMPKTEGNKDGGENRGDEKQSAPAAGAAAANDASHGNEEVRYDAGDMFEMDDFEEAQAAPKAVPVPKATPANTRR